MKHLFYKLFIQLGKIINNYPYNDVIHILVMQILRYLRIVDTNIESTNDSSNYAYISKNLF